VPNGNQERSIQQRSQAKITKLIRHLDLFIEADNLKKSQVLRYFSKLHRIKKLFIQIEYSETPEELVINFLRRVFRTLRGLEQINLKGLGPLQKDFKTFKNLILQRSLQKLIVSPLMLSEDINSLVPFMELSQAAYQRKCWPHLKYLRAVLEYSEEYVGNRGAGGNQTESLKNLLKFLQEFKSCESLYKCSHFQLELPMDEDSNLPSTEIAVFDEILKERPPFTSISASQGEHISRLFKTAQYLKNLKRLDLSLSNELPDYLEMGPLGKFPALQEMSLIVNCTDEFDDESPEAHLSYFALEKMGSMTNLRSISLFFDGDPSSVEDLLCNALSKLTELTHLNLQFSNMIPFEEQFEEDYYDEEYEEEDDEEENEREERGGSRKLSWGWLKEIFQSIGKMKKLKELSLGFETFSFEDSGSLFKSLCQALGRLTHLSSLWLYITDGELMKDQDICALASYVNKLTMMESFFLSIGNSTFKPNTFVQLMDSMVKNLKILSELDLKIHCDDVTKQCQKLIYEGIRQMKCLNKMKLEIGGKVGKGVNLALLDAEVRKRMAGGISGSRY